MKNVNKVNRRILSFFLLTLFFWCIVVYRLYNLQVVNNEKFQVSANNEHTYSDEIPAPRGLIKSSDGIELAINSPVYGVYVYTPNIKNQSNFEDSVLPIFKYNKDDFESMITQGATYFQIAKDISPSDKDILEKKISSTNLSTLNFVLEEKRIYPNNTLLSQTLGYVDINTHVGKYGIEGYFENSLKGVSGKILGNQDSNGNPIVNGKFNVVSPTPGKDITLTVNAQIQKEVEDKLKQGVDDKLADGGSAIVMDPKTGAIIAMANYPTYDPNQYFNGYVIDCNNYIFRDTDYCKKKSDKPDLSNISEAFDNSSVSFLFEPGSVIKAITAAAALQENKITPDTKFDDKTGVYQVKDQRVYNWNRKPNGVMTMEDILLKSSNVGASMVSSLIGKDLMYKYYKDFGIGSQSGITLQGEDSSYLLPTSEWHDIDLATASFGQFISATPLQVASIYQTIANNGIRMEPYVDNSAKPKQLGQIISSDTATKLVQMLTYTTTGEPAFGLTQTKDFIPIIAGKTGTAQIPLKNGKGYDPNLINATYVGFAPAEDPKFLLLVTLKSPRNGQYSSGTAVPVWDNIAKDLFVYYKIVPPNK